MNTLTSKLNRLNLNGLVSRSYSGVANKTSSLGSSLNRQYTTTTSRIITSTTTSNIYSTNNNSITHFNSKRQYTTQATTTTANIETSNITSSNNIIVPGESVSFPIVNFASKQSIGQVNLLKSVFQAPLRIDLLHRVVRWQRNKAMQGTHYAQNMGDIDRTNKKPFAQKGNGRARQGTNHAIQMKGGARAFPPKPRSHEHGLQKKVRKLAMRVALSTKLAQGKLIVVDQLEVNSHKTKDLDKLVPQEWGISLLVDNEFSNNMNLAAFNLNNCHLINERGLNVFSILQKDTLVISKSALEILQQRLSTL